MSQSPGSLVCINHGRRYILATVYVKHHIFFTAPMNARAFATFDVFVTTAQNISN